MSFVIKFIKTLLIKLQCNKLVVQDYVYLKKIVWNIDNKETMRILHDIFAPALALLAQFSEGNHENASSSIVLANTNNNAILENLQINRRNNIHKDILDDSKPSKRKSETNYDNETFKDSQPSKRYSKIDYETAFVAASLASIINKIKNKIKYEKIIDDKGIIDDSQPSKQNSNESFEDDETPIYTNGLAFIINNNTFDNSEENSERFGSKKDIEALERTFKCLRITSKLYEDPSVSEIAGIVGTIKEMDFGDIPCLIVVIMSHGSRNNRVHAKDESYSLDDNVLHTILENESLKDKPKLFFIQSCRGEMQTDSKQEKKKVCNSPDEVFRAYSTFEGFVAYRTPEEGSYFIQSLCTHLMRFGYEKNVKEIMEDVIKDVKEMTNGRQTPCYMTTLTKSVILGKRKIVTDAEKPKD